MDIPPQVLSQLAPKGMLRAGINLSNFLLVSSRREDGTPVGVAPDMAKALADRLGVPIRYVPYATPGELGDAAGQDQWDVGFIGAEPQRARTIAFSAAYVEIPATYMVGPESGMRSIVDLDRPGVRIASTARAAYDLWLERNLEHAELLRFGTLDEAYDSFVAMKLDALAGLHARLLADARKLPGARILPGQFSSVQQAIGTALANQAAAAFVAGFVEEAKASGLVSRLIDEHRVQGLVAALSRTRPSSAA